MTAPPPFSITCKTLTMRNDEQQEQFNTDFTAIMYAKGYRAPAHLILENTRHTQRFQHLGACIDAFFEQRKQGHFQNGLFKFKTEINNIDCEFTVALDNVMGLRVKELVLTSKKIHQPVRLNRFFSNRQVPGAAQVRALFPKPKPWWRRGRGDFRP